MSQHMLSLWASGVVCAGLLFSSASILACPIGQMIKVDNDIPGSGYSETTQNWLSRSVEACNGSYRYLSHTIGDGSRKGKAIWTPNITTTGWYRVRTSFRATENRTSDADYIVHDDHGQRTRTSISQKHNGDCTIETLGVFYCAVNGDCKVVLDGTDDNQSDAADMTTFELVSCDPNHMMQPTMGRCDGIRQNPQWEVCEETPTRCVGVFQNGVGCTAFCQAAGMTCVARYGGEPGCQKEAQTPIPCDANNGHGSDWCECEGPAPATTCAHDGNDYTNGQTRCDTSGVFMRCDNTQWINTMMTCGMQGADMSSMDMTSTDMTTTTMDMTPEVPGTSDMTSSDMTQPDSSSLDMNMADQSQTDLGQPPNRQNNLEGDACTTTRTSPTSPSNPLNVMWGVMILVGAVLRRRHHRRARQ